MKRLLSASVIYTLGYLLSRLQTFILLPFLTLHLSNAEYGLVEALAAAGVFIMMSSVFNIDSGFTAHFHSQEREDHKTALIQGSFSLIFTLSLATLFVTFILKDQLGYLATSRPDSGTMFFMSALAAVLAGLIHFQLVVTRMLEKPWHYTWTVLVQTFTYFCLSVLFLNLFTNKVLAVLLAQVIGNFFALLLTCFLNFRFIPRSLLPMKIWHKELFKIAIPLFPFSLASWGMNLFDRGFISHTRGLYETGIYAIAAKIAQMASLIFSPFQLAWLPRSLKSLNENTENTLFPISARNLLFISGLALIALTGFSKSILLLIAPNSFLAAQPWIGILVFCNLLTVLYTFASSRFLFKKKSQYSTYSFIGGAVINVIINLLLTPKYGIPGAITANLFGYSFMFLASMYFAHRIHPVNFKFSKKSVLIALILTISLCPIFIHLDTFFHQLLFTLVATGVFGFGYLVLFGRPRFQ